MLLSLFLYAAKISNAQSFENDTDSIEFDPDSTQYEEKLFSYLSSFGPIVMDDPYFLNIRKPSNGSISVRGKKPSAQDFNLRAVKQIKTMVIAMMNPKVIEQGMKDGTIVQGGTGFGRYCFYGCHCLPDHEHASKSKPFGKPKDGIDETCKQMGVCYKCIENKYKGKCNQKPTNYRFELKKDKNGKYNDIVCTDRDECKKDICECDRAFAINVKKHELDWNVKLHSTKSGFNREKECKRASGGKGGGHETIGCCGKIPNVSIRKDNEQCCGKTAYNDKRRQCCNPKSGEVLAKGSC